MGNGGGVQRRVTVHTEPTLSTPVASLTMRPMSVPITMTRSKMFQKCAENEPAAGREKGRGGERRDETRRDETRRENDGTDRCFFFSPPLHRPAALPPALQTWASVLPPSPVGSRRVNKTTQKDSARRGARAERVVRAKVLAPQRVELDRRLACNVM